MIFKPHPYQLTAARRLLDRPFTFLQADPGTGKTAICLMVIHELKKRGELPPTLIIAPLRIATSVWPDEITKWDQFHCISYRVIQGAHKAREAAHPADVHLTNLESLAWMHEHGLLSRYRMVIFDESSKFKTWSAKRTKIIKKYLGAFERRYALTGSPAPKSLADIFPQQYLVDRGASFGRYITRFQSKYLVDVSPHMSPKWEVRPGAAEGIYRKMAPFCHRLDAAKLLDMPPLITEDIKIPLPKPVQEQALELLKQIAVTAETSTWDALSAGSEYMQSRRIAGGISPEGDVMHDEKLKALDDLIEGLQGQHALVFFYYRAEGDVLTKRLNAPMIRGGTSVAESNESMRAWNARELPLLLLHPAATGHGLNLQAGGNHVIWYSLTDNYDDYFQAIRRVWRQGVAGTVFNHRLIARNSVDIAMLAGLEAKGDRQRAVLDAMERLTNG